MPSSCWVSPVSKAFRGLPLFLQVLKLMTELVGWPYNHPEDSMAQSEIIFSIQESPEGGFEARALGHSIFSQADSLDELKSMLRDAVACHFADGDRPSVIRLHLVKDEVISA